ncbi:MAG: DUF1736 domain-containing protein, partial [Planctomycetota bacterium]
LPTRDLALGILCGLPAAALFVWLYLLAVGDYLPSYLSNPLIHEPTAVRLMTAPMLWVYGLYKVVLPFSLCCDYSPNTFQLVRELTDPRLLGCVMVLAAALGAGLFYASRQPLAFLAMASFWASASSSPTCRLPWRRSLPSVSTTRPAWGSCSWWSGCCSSDGLC